MAARAITPPPGFELEQQSGQITPPPGFELETSAPPPVPKPPNPILTQEEGWDPITPGNAATGFLKSLYQTSAPGIAASILQKHAPQAAQSIPESLQGMPLEQVPAAAIATFFGGEEPTTQLAEHTVTAPGAMALPKIGKPGMVSRVAEHLPVIGKGVRLYNLGREMFGQEEAPPAPTPPAPVPQTNGIEWGTGGQGPLDLRGKAIPPDAQTLPTIEAPAPKAAPVKPIQMQDAIERGLGNEPVKIQPGVKMKDQPANGLPKISDMAPGHTPIESSSALRSYRYDPASREFQVHPQGGSTVYVYGDVSPEAAASFEQSGSKGQAWQQLRSNPLVAKIQGGQRIAMRGAPKAPEAPAQPIAPSKPIAPEAPKPPLDMSRSPEDYAHSQEAQTKVGYPLPQLLKDHPDWAKGWLNYEGQPTLKVYRGVEGPGTPIARGNYVSTSREGAQQYGSHVEELEVPAKHLRYVRGAETGEAKNLDVGGKPELIYAPPKAKATTPPPSEDLTGILRQSVEQVRKKKASQSK